MRGQIHAVRSLGLELWLGHPAVLFIARLCLVSAFLVSGIVKLLDFSGAVAEVRGLTGLEPAGIFAAVVIVVQLGGSALVLAGGRACLIGAALLAGFTIVATLLAHSFWTKTGPEAARDLAIFFEHLGLVGGFCLAAIVAARMERARR